MARITKKELKNELNDVETLIKAFRLFRWSDKATAIVILTKAVDKTITFQLDFEKWICSYKKHQWIVDCEFYGKLELLRQFDTILGEKKINGENMWEVEMAVSEVLYSFRGALKL